MTEPKPASKKEIANYEVVPVMMEMISGLSSIRLYIPRDLRTPDGRNAVGKSLDVVKSKFPDGIPFLDPIEDMKIEDPSFLKLLRKLELTEERMNGNEWFQKNGGSVEKVMESKEMKSAVLKQSMDEEIKKHRKTVKDCEDVLLKKQLKAMKRVLRRLNYTNSEDIIQLKGRVACEINAADELVLTELIFSGVFADLSIEQVVAVLSCFVFQEKVDSNLKLRDELSGPFRTLEETAKRIGKICQECKVMIDMEQYMQQFSPHMMEVTYSWAKGAKFKDICGMTDVFEGSIIRCMRRLEELMRQLSAAAKGIGNTQLEQKFAEGISKIKRDIVFAASLYL